MGSKGKRFVSYLRVSTAKQGDSGLGIEAQREAVSRYVAGEGGRNVGEFVEVESGKQNTRPQLAAALGACRRYRAVLVIAKIDRLARNASFLLGLRDAGVEFVAADMPGANRMTVGIMAVVAEEEAAMISARTKAALAAAKARGVKLGGNREGAYAVHTHSAQGNVASAAVRRDKARQRAAGLAAAVWELQAQGAVTLAQMAEGLNAMDIPAPRGGNWAPIQVSRLLARIEEAA